MPKRDYRLTCKTVLHSLETSPLLEWSNCVKTGYVIRVADEELQSMVLELMGENVACNFIALPKEPTPLSIKLPILVLFVKNMKKGFTFEVQINDSKKILRRFRASNLITEVRSKPFICKIPLSLDLGWNQLKLDLREVTKLLFGTDYVETTHLQIHANCRIRRIFFADRQFHDTELPREYRLGMTKNQHIKRIVEKVGKETRENAEKLTMEAIKNHQEKMKKTEVIAAAQTSTPKVIAQVKATIAQPKSRTPSPKNLSPKAKTKETSIKPTVTVLLNHDATTSQNENPNTKPKVPIPKKPVSILKNPLTPKKQENPNAVPTTEAMKQESKNKSTVHKPAMQIAQIRKELGVEVAPPKEVVQVKISQQRAPAENDQKQQATGRNTKGVVLLKEFTPPTPPTTVKVKSKTAGGRKTKRK